MQGIFKKQQIKKELVKSLTPYEFFKLYDLAIFYLKPFFLKKSNLFLRELRFNFFNSLIN